MGGCVYGERVEARQDRTGNRSVEAPPGPSDHRQIVVCCDGTNNTLTGGVKDTNVVQLYHRLQAERERGAAQHPPAPEQVLYYDPGVGAGAGLPPTGVCGIVTEFGRRVAGLALGSGIYDNIGQAYLFLCREYGRHDAGRGETSDEIYLFGFSRGAFTVRAVGGMVNLFGLIRPEHEVLLPTLLSVYFAKASDQFDASAVREYVGLHGMLGEDAVPNPVPQDDGSSLLDPDARAPRTAEKPVVRTEARAAPRAASPAVRAIEALGAATSQRSRKQPGAQGRPAKISREAVAAQIRAQFTTPIGRDAPIHFIGAWDTVDSVGILPVARTRISSAPTIYKNRYRHVRHALALDEHRRQFRPRDFDGRVRSDQTLKQVWFRGVHSDIGGSKPSETSLLSWPTLHWMTDEAIDWGLRLTKLPDRFDKEEATMVEVIGDQLRAQPAWALTGMLLRDPTKVDGEGWIGEDQPDGKVRRPAPKPREHGTVKLYSRRIKGPQRGIPVSPWERGNGPRPLALLLQFSLIAAVALVSLAMAGALATPGSAGWRLLDAWDKGLNLLVDQLPISFQFHDANARFERWAREDVSTSHASYGWAQLFLLAAILSVAVLGARLPARAFGRMTRGRSIRTPYPRPAWKMNLLGLGYAVMVLAFSFQTILMMVAWALGGANLRWVLLGLAAVAGVAVIVGAVLVAALLLLWVTHEVAGWFSSRRER